MVTPYEITSCVVTHLQEIRACAACEAEGIENAGAVKSAYGYEIPYARVKYHTRRLRAPFVPVIYAACAACEAV